MTALSTRAVVGCLTATLLVAVLSVPAVHAQGNVGRGLVSVEVRDLDFVVDPDSRETRTFTYDQRGNRVGQVVDVDVNVDNTVDRRITFTYTNDQRGNVVLEVQDIDSAPLGSNDRRRETTFTYDQRGNLVQQVQEIDQGVDGTVDRRNDFTFEYDRRGNRVARTRLFDDDNNGVADRSEFTLFVRNNRGDAVQITRESDFNNDGLVDEIRTSRFERGQRNNLVSGTREYDFDPFSPPAVDRLDVFEWDYDQRGLLVERRQEVDPSLAPVAVQWSVAEGGNGHWYQLSSRPVSGLDDAIQLAASTPLAGETPGYVVSILSEGEKDFLVGAFGGTTQYLIGYTDRDQEGVWEWVSGESSGFTFWASDEPNNFNNEDIAIMNWQHEIQPAPQPPGAWNDLGGFGGSAIFEYNSSVLPVLPTVFTNSFSYDQKGNLVHQVLEEDRDDDGTLDVVRTSDFTY